MKINLLNVKEFANSLMLRSKKGFVIDQMVELAVGIVILAVVAVIGVVVAQNLGASTGTGIANTSANYAAGYLGSTTTGGLLTWLPVIIPAVIGIAIIGYFLGMRKPM